MNNCYQTGEAHQWFQCCRHQTLTDLFLFNTNLFCLLLFHLWPNTGIKTGSCHSPNFSKCLLQVRCWECEQVCPVCFPWHQRRPQEENPSESFFAGSCFLSPDSPSPWPSSAGCEQVTRSWAKAPPWLWTCSATNSSLTAKWWKRSP